MSDLRQSWEDGKGEVGRDRYKERGAAGQRGGGAHCLHSKAPKGQGVRGMGQVT